jgi:hypothetical protein
MGALFQIMVEIEHASFSASPILRETSQKTAHKTLYGDW